MRILITGASGSIGTVVREVYGGCDVVLLSRKYIEPRPNEVWFKSKGLGENSWWSALPKNVNYDLVYHLAEPVKKYKKHESVDCIVKGHDDFIKYALGCTAMLVYPLTAYLYDNNLAKSNRSYSEIKKKVYYLHCNNQRISFPVYHPLLDHGNGLYKLVKYHRAVPFINLFSEFKNSLPVLTINDLKEKISSSKYLIPGKVDIYTSVPCISDIFSCPDKVNNLYLSNILLNIMKSLCGHANINLLVNGRSISEMRCINPNISVKTN